MVWYGFWLFFIYETPSVHPTISVKEREHIEETAVSADEVFPVFLLTVCLRIYVFYAYWKVGTQPASLKKLHS